MQTDQVRENLKCRRISALMLFAFALVVCLLVSCKSTAQTHTREVPLQIELDAFSGRPNPNWRLTADQVVEFLKKFHALKAAPGVHSAPNNLGYRGFVVTANDETVGGYDELRVYHGLVFASRGDRTETFIDSERSMEHSLFDSSQDHVPESILQYIQSEIQR